MHSHFHVTAGESGADIIQLSYFVGLLVSNE